MEYVETILSILFDGQFWIAIVERRDGGGLCLARHVFGSEPGAAQILKWIEGDYSKLRFVSVSPEALAKTKKAAGNPKRAKREAARALRDAKAVSKAHEAMRLIRENTKKGK